MSATIWSDNWRWNWASASIWSAGATGQPSFSIFSQSDRRQCPRRPRRPYRHGQLRRPQDALINAWLARRPHYHVHFTPTFASWINQIERWFAELTRKQIQQGVHTSTAQLKAESGLHHRHNANPKPIRYTKSADDILAAVKRFWSSRRCADRRSSSNSFGWALRTSKPTRRSAQRARPKRRRPSRRPSPPSRAIAGFPTRSSGGPSCASPRAQAAACALGLAQRDSNRAQLRAQALARVQPLPLQRRARNPKPDRRAFNPRDNYRTPQLAIRRAGRRREARGQNLEHHREVQSVWRRTRSLPRRLNSDAGARTPSGTRER